LVLGPTIDLEDSAGQKMLALFGRAAPRDFVDVFALAARYSRAELLAFAVRRDAAFDGAVFADMITLLAQISDRQLGVTPDRAAAIRQFFARWRSELRHVGPAPAGQSSPAIQSSTWD